jgi:hypothetical protein
MRFHSNLSNAPCGDIRIGRRCEARRHPGSRPFTFIAHHGLTHHNTRAYVRLLGPCFKTGRFSPFRQASGSCTGPPRPVTSGGAKAPGSPVPSRPARQRTSAPGLAAHVRLPQPGPRYGSRSVTRTRRSECVPPATFPRSLVPRSRADADPRLAGSAPGGAPAPAPGRPPMREGCPDTVATRRPS